MTPDRAFRFRMARFELRKTRRLRVAGRCADAERAFRRAKLWRYDRKAAAEGSSCQ